MTRDRLYFCINLLSFLIIQKCVVAQPNLRVYSDSVFDKYASGIIHEFVDSKPYYIIEWQANAPKNIHVVRQLNQRVAIIEVKTSVELQLLSQQGKVAAALDAWKFSPSAERRFSASNREQQFIVSCSNLDFLLHFLQNIKYNEVILSVDKPSRSVVIKTSMNFVKEKLLPLKEVTFIDLSELPHDEAKIIGYDRSFDGINAVDYAIPGANGHNIVAGVKEHKMQEDDLDLYKRVLPSTIAAADVTDHATVISSIIGGSGNRFYDGRGIANACRFFPSTFSNLFADDSTVLNENHVSVQNHSYGTVIQQFYGAEAVSYDEQAWENKKIIHVFSAGNEGTYAATDGPYANIPGFANLTGNFKMAKNVITVGAIDNNENIPPQSSAGPLYDGRLAPQLIALGPNGTSDAAAVVSGTIAVMQQVYADSNNHSLPPASLVKAVLYNSADDVYRVGIDYKTGFGLLNSFAAIQSVQRKEYDGGTIKQDQSWIKTISVPAAAAQLKVTLVWIDTTATANNYKALVNDLDLQVSSLSDGSVYKPWVLNSTPDVDSLSQLPTRRRDSLNTAEQVSLYLPPAGNYEIKVTGTSVQSGSLPFHVAFHIDTLNKFAFTSPQNTADIRSEEQPAIFIRWRTFVADSNETGNLYVSYDRGKNWQLIQSSYKIYRNEYLWTVKDTVSTGLFKMETSFGSFLSKEFVISPVTRLSVDFLCTDSFRLSWNKHVYANSYNIYALTDSPYLKKVMTVPDTSVVLKRSVNHEVVYAVQPLLRNNISAARSPAINIEQQNVQCFFKTFYYNLLSQNVLQLVLEVGGVSYIDKIYFERVTQAGKALQTYEGIKTNTSTIYSQSITNVPFGTSYWRAKIKLKSGEVVYTYNISVLTSGSKYIIFYPNPLSGNISLRYTLQQDLPTDCKLQIFDIIGRLMKNYPEMPNTIDLRTFNPGVYIYRLLTNDEKILETGKLVVL